MRTQYWFNCCLVPPLLAFKSTFDAFGVKTSRGGLSTETVRLKLCKRINFDELYRHVDRL